MTSKIVEDLLPPAVDIGHVRPDPGNVRHHPPDFGKKARIENDAGVENGSRLCQAESPRYAIDVHNSVKACRGGGISIFDLFVISAASPIPATQPGHAPTADTRTGQLVSRIEINFFRFHSILRLRGRFEPCYPLGDILCLCVSPKVCTKVRHFQRPITVCERL